MSVRPSNIDTVDNLNHIWHTLSDILNGARKVIQESTYSWVLLLSFVAFAFAVAAAPPLAHASNKAGVSGRSITAGRFGPRAKAAATCPSSAFCMWSGTSFTGTLYYYSINNYSQGEWHYVGSEANDKAESLYNNRVHTTWVSENWPPSEGEACIKPGQEYTDLVGKHFPNNIFQAWNSISSFVLSEKETSCSSSWEFKEIEEAVKAPEGQGPPPFSGQ